MSRWGWAALSAVYIVFSVWSSFNLETQTIMIWVYPALVVVMLSNVATMTFRFVSQLRKWTVLTVAVYLLFDMMFWFLLASTASEGAQLDIDVWLPYILISMQMMVFTGVCMLAASIYDAFGRAKE